ncbi:Aristolochene synthase [Apiospora arundinis]|uniref:Terpene synthase n=1 Tax=Apiospora arundinis TaxID=335852 RepID=A0ABR2J421_9PEZI
MVPVSAIGDVLSWSSKRSKVLLSFISNGLSWSSAKPDVLQDAIPSTDPEDALPPWYMAVRPTRFTPVCHPHVARVQKEVDTYFLENWPFPNSKSRKRFLGADFTRCMCYNYPEALDDRIAVACRLITLLFLVDDLLDCMSLDDGRIYNDKMMSVMKGDCLPDRTVAVEWMACDIWTEMRTLDAKLAGEILGPLADFMAAQTEEKRLKKMGLGEYLDWRRRDVGASLVTALGRFAMGLALSADDLALVEPLDRIWFRHYAVMNDVWSYDKEVRQSKESREEGAVLRSSVAILCDDTQMSAEAAKRTLTYLCREWEDQHKALEKEILAKKDTPAIRQYIRGLEYQMSGNEIWSTFTLRYAPPTTIRQSTTTEKEQPTHSAIDTRDRGASSTGDGHPSQASFTYMHISFILLFLVLFATFFYWFTEHGLRMLYHLVHQLILSFKRPADSALVFLEEEDNKTTRF